MKLIILVLSISLAYANTDFDAYIKQYQKSYNAIETLKR